MARGTLYGPNGAVIKVDPDQDELSAGGTDGGKGRYVDIAESQYSGLPLVGDQVVSPIYYAVQTFADATVIHYLSLFAYQPGQTVNALRLGSNFRCIVNTFGIHQGDLERVAVVLSNDGANRVLAVEYEAHGDTHFYAPLMVVPAVNDKTGWHPQVHVSLNGHSQHNQFREENPDVEDEVPGFVATISLMADPGMGIVWNPATVNDPHAFRALGLDELGRPIGSEHWALFAGRLGKHRDNELVSATYVDGKTNLDPNDWSFVKLVDVLATLFDKYPENIKKGDGPEGPGARKWVRQPATDALYLGETMAVINKANDLGQGPGNVHLCAGRFFSTDRNSILQFWDNDRTCAVFAYAIGDDGHLSCFSSNPNLGQGPDAFQWLNGRFYGADVEQAIQLFDNGGGLGMIVYGIGNTDSVHCLWSTDNIGQGSGHLDFLTGDFTGSGQDEILQCYANGGALGMILYRADASGAITNPWSNPDMGEGPGAVKWLVGDFTGGGKDQVLQCWANGSQLGMILWGDDGNGGLKGLWRSNDVGQGWGAVQWLVGDFDGKGKDQVLQCCANGGQLATILYRFDGNGILASVWANPDMGEGWGAETWLIGDFNGDGKDQILQCWANGAALGMIVYGDDGNGGLEGMWSLNNLHEGPGNVGWFAGNFDGRGRDRVIQLWDNGHLAAIEYGTLADG